MNARGVEDVASRIKNCCLGPEVKGIFPTRSILTKLDLDNFLVSDAYNKYMGFITDLNESIKNVPLNSKLDTSDVVAQISNLLSTIKGWIDDIPVEDPGLSRFGNPSFRIWLDRLKLEMEQLLGTFVPNAYLGELGGYFGAAFGDYQRIDYGTGHEANFMCFLLSLQELLILKISDHSRIVLILFWDYIKVMRKLQSVYWLEPAGSHGVWGLDDYHFLPFLFGSAQLLDHKYLRPKSIHDTDILEEYGDDYMYLSSIKHINSIKSASLRWHSPMLDDISGVKKWEKVNSGMFKMYQAEVLGKLPIMQHFLFGSLISFAGSASETDSSQGLEHVHALGQEYPGCCSIRIPSAAAALYNRPIKIPFD